jgi:MFS transporter, SHS family, lactate transporter
MLRSVGAAIFGILGDRYGRKWPFIANLVLLIIFEMATGFVQTFSQFLAVRALFGIAMGGMYGNASSTALEDAPLESRGLLSGLLQEGYAFGYLLAAVFNLAITGNNPHGWRALFWFAAGPPVLLILWRMYLPETDAFNAIQEERREHGHQSVAKGFIKQALPTLKQHGFRLIYLVLLMAGFNFMSHGSQDLYPTFLQRQLGFSEGKTTVTTVVANLGAICGGALVGHMSTFFGRRLSIIVAAVVGAALIPAWILVRNNGIMAAAFFEQFCVQGAWGYPSYLNDCTNHLVLFPFTCWNCHHLTSEHLSSELPTNSVISPPQRPQQSKQPSANVSHCHPFQTALHVTTTVKSWQFSWVAFSSMSLSLP